MRGNSKEMESLAKLAIDVEIKIDETTQIINAATKASDKTVRDFQNTKVDIKSMVKSVNDINEISTENAKSVEKIASASEHLNKMTGNLTDTLNQFTIYLANFEYNRGY